MDWEKQVPFFRSGNSHPVKAKLTLYPKGSIVIKKISAYALVNKEILFDWARVWYKDGTVSEFPWRPFALDEHKRDIALWKNLTSQHGYRLIKGEDPYGAAAADLRKQDVSTASGDDRAPDTGTGN